MLQAVICLQSPRSRRFTSLSACSHTSNWHIWCRCWYGGRGRNCPWKTSERSYVKQVEFYFYWLVDLLITKVFIWVYDNVFLLDRNIYQCQTPTKIYIVFIFTTSALLFLPSRVYTLKESHLVNSPEIGITSPPVFLQRWRFSPHGKQHRLFCHRSPHKLFPHLITCTFHKNRKPI